ncbi:dihydrolipoamide acetyltransferase family protein [Nocardioides cynanchi]|uniref:dihydrolipoamide acetyltransferase family protein n=1 Tax=Nocardioides cynanchi TaxID=2558918 RepID=UPI001248EDFE|nr:dihydrolipoamide acetyltransferase family protein [Nocardioides cynanchi]
MARRPIRMPKMSMTMTEGEVSTWLVEVGAEVRTGDPVCEVMTDKVDMEVESTVSGTLVEIVHDSGMVDVGEPIGWVESDDEDTDMLGDLFEPDDETPAAAPDLVPEAAPVVPEPEAPGPEPVADDRPVAAVPRARALALAHSLDLATVTGSGPDGLVTVADVEALADRPAPAAAVAAPAPVAPEPTPPPAAAPRPPASPDRRTAVRRVVARTMTPSAAIPQFTVWREIRLDTADAARAGVSWTTVLLRAYAAGLRAVPELLSRWEDGGPTEPGPPAVALAVATDRGLLVPTFVEPDLGEAADRDRELRAVVQAAQTGKVDPAYMAVANASLSNLGGLGVDRFNALLTPPQGSVLALGSIRRRPVAVPGGVGLALTLEAGLTVDHRIADGAHGAALLDEIVRYLG